MTKAHGGGEREFLPVGIAARCTAALPFGQAQLPPTHDAPVGQVASQALQ